MTLREEREQLERRILSARASCSCDTRGRQTADPPCRVRTEFQRDRDRILYSKAFRRLKHKTQVFIAPEGDHYRTRLTHTLEVAQIARTIARALCLNEDLAEAGALGHDLGHSPFGHAGEQTLDRLLSQYAPGQRFRHYEQSLRVVDLLEKKGGLNLTWEVREAILGHSKGRQSLEIRPLATDESAEGVPLDENRRSLPGAPEDDEAPPSPLGEGRMTLEAQIVRLSDRLAYINHDIDDAIRAGILKPESIPASCGKVLGHSSSQRINTLVLDVVETSREGRLIRMSPPVARELEILKEFMFEQVYVDSAAKQEEEKACDLIAYLYEYFMRRPDGIPRHMVASGLDVTKMSDRARVVTDHIAGMTDRYALALFQQLFVPHAWHLNWSCRSPADGDGD